MKIVSIKARTKRLTPREREVVGWLAQGKSIQEVATILNIASNTVAIHNDNAARKLDTQNRMKLVLAAIRLGIIPCPCATNAAHKEAA